MGGDYGCYKALGLPDNLNNNGYTAVKLTGVTGFTPKEYLQIMDLFAISKGTYVNDLMEEVSDYVYDDVLEPLGFPADGNSGACGLEFGKAFCMAGATPCSRTANNTVRVPCSYCQAMFDPSKSCGGPLAGKTLEEMNAAVDALTQAKLSTVVASFTSMDSSPSWNTNTVKAVLKHAFKTAYEGCTKNTCRTCGNSFYVYDNALSTPAVFNSGATTCGSAPEYNKPASDYQCARPAENNLVCKNPAMYSGQQQYYQSNGTCDQVIGSLVSRLPSSNSHHLTCEALIDAAYTGESS